MLAVNVNGNFKVSNVGDGGRDRAVSYFVGILSSGAIGLIHMMLLLSVFFMSCCLDPGQPAR